MVKMLVLCIISTASLNKPPSRNRSISAPEPYRNVAGSAHITEKEEDYFIDDH